MKTLQSNFTTPEQSKRLLELGVPVDSADCYTTTENGRAVVLNILFSEFNKNIVAGGFNNPESYLPCWSVGRLLEIYLRCSDRECFSHNEITFYYDEPILDLVYELFVVAAGLNELDFSKLEE